MIQRIASGLRGPAMITLSLVIIVLSLYLLIGPRVMGFADRWTAEVESLLSETTGMPVRVSGLEGGWQGFGPTLDLDGLTLVGPDGKPALTLSRVSVSLDVPVSLLSGQWRAGRIRLRDLDLTVREQDDGGWRIAGLGLGNAVPDPRQLFRLLARLGDVEILDTRVLLQGAGGRSLQFDDLALLFHSRGDHHQLQADAWLANDSRRITVRAALRGDELDALSGPIHVRLPGNDLGLLAGFLQTPELALRELTVGLEARAELSESRLMALDLELGMPELVLHQRQRDRPVTVNAAAMELRYRREGQRHRLRVDDLQFRRDGRYWQPGATSLSWRAGQDFALRSEWFDVGMAVTLSRDLGLLEGRLREVLDTLAPRGVLRELSVDGGLGTGGLTDLSVRGNLDDVRVDAHQGAPALWGVDGYTQFRYGTAQRRLTGFVEVDSRDLGIQLPRLFDQAWNYDHVNGRVRVRLDMSDGTDLRVSSSVITAESPVIAGRAQFATTLRQREGQRPEVGLELLVGALHGDASAKSAYLPMGPAAPPDARGALRWVDAAVRGGEVAGSGFVFRGRVGPDTGPAENAIQMFYRVSEGVLAYDPAWPPLEDVRGLVVIDGARVGVNATAGRSLGIRFRQTRAEVRPNPDGPGSWLTVQGEGRGTAPQGLEYLRSTPVTEGLGNYLAGWRTRGDVDFSLELELPLFIEEASPVINLSLGVQDNEATIPELQLTLEDINGRLNYSSDGGIRGEGFSARVFGKPVTIDVTSSDWGAGVNDTTLQASGQVSMASLRDWALVPAPLRRLLAPASGTTAYELDLLLPQRDDRAMQPSLDIASDLSGIGLDYPVPLDKQADEAWPLDVSLQFSSPDPSQLSVRLGDLASMNARLEEGAISSGLLFLGPPGDGVRVRRLDSSAPGLQVLGRLPDLEVEQWLSFARRLPGPEIGISALAGLTGGVDVNIDQLGVYGDAFRNVNVQLSRREEGLRLAVTSDDLAGRVLFPDDAAPWQVDFSTIHIDADGAPSGADAAQAGAENAEIRFEELDPVEYVMPRTDPLDFVDPRQFPAMDFHVEDLRVAGAEYGTWTFRLRPRDDRAVFEGVRGESRGLRVGEPDQPARLVWYHDGQDHESALEGIVSAGDMAPVLQSFGYAPVLESDSANFEVDLEWQGSPAFLSAVGVNGEVSLALDDGRFRSGTGAANGALKLISIINFDALIRRLRFSDDLLREGLAYEEIRGRMFLDDGVVTIQDRLQIIGPSSLFQLSGSVNLPEQTIDGQLYITLPVSDNLPWVSGLAALNNLINWQVAVGVFVLEQIFGEQVDSLTSAQYTLQGPWDSLEPRLTQAFTSGGEIDGEQQPGSQ